MPATLVTASQRIGFARQSAEAATLAAYLVDEDDGDWDTAELCALIAARADDVLRGPSRSWKKCISRSSGVWQFDNHFGGLYSQQIMKMRGDEVKKLTTLLKLPLDGWGDFVVNRNRFSAIEAVTVLLVRLSCMGTWHQLASMLGGRAPSAYSHVFVEMLRHQAPAPEVCALPR